MCLRFQMTKAIHPSTSNEMESLFEGKITGLQLLSLFHQELHGSSVGAVWFCHRAGSQGHSLTPRVADTAREPEITKKRNLSS